MLLFGHIHKKIIHGNIVYPGSTISFGFDELGEHGVIEVNLQKDEIEKKFIKLDETEFKEINLNISEIFSEEELIEKINGLNLQEKNYYKIILEGNKNIEINKNKILKIIDKKNILKIKDFSKLNFNLEKIKEENNLKGYFIREIMEIKNSHHYTEEEIAIAIEIGLRALQN